MHMIKPGTVFSFLGNVCNTKNPRLKVDKREGKGGGFNERQADGYKPSADSDDEVRSVVVTNAKNVMLLDLLLKAVVLF